MLSKRRQYETGAAIAEFAVFAAVLIFAVAYFWRAWVVEELRHSMVVSAYTTLNERVVTGFRPYRLDPANGKVPFSAAAPQSYNQLLAGLRELGDLTLSRITSSSKISGISSNLQCSIAIGYLDVNSGTVAAIQPGLTAQITVPAGATISSGLNSAMALARQNYIQAISGKVISGPIAKILNPGQSNPTLLYFNYSAYYVWGCEGDGLGFGFLTPHALLAELVVPVA